MTEVLTRDEVDALDTIVAESIEPIAPPPELRRRILDAINGVPQDSRTIRAEQGRWHVLPFPGVKVKPLSVDAPARMRRVLTAFDPGARLPAHDHHGDEESFVV